MAIRRQWQFKFFQNDQMTVWVQWSNIVGSLYKEEEATEKDRQRLREVGAILIGFWYVFFHKDCSILDKLFELRPFMQTVIPQEKHVDRLFLTLRQSPEIINFEIIFAFSE